MVAGAGKVEGGRISDERAFGRKTPKRCGNTLRTSNPALRQGR